ncbi:MAG: MFS transporter [Paracoccaceae bacterium]
MAEVTMRKRVWGWMMFDWASQPFLTLLLTFIFGPYFAEIVSDQLMASGMAETAAKAEAQAYWGYGLTVAGLSIAVLAPIFGSIADSSGRRLPWIWGFSALYVIGCTGLWLAAPGALDVKMTLFYFGIGMIGMELATIFTNAMLPELGGPSEVGRISGNGWAWGYVGGILALVLTLFFFAENSEGKTFLGLAPALGLDPEAREGTRFVGPFSALWYGLFMIPFFLWVKDAPRDAARIKTSFVQGLRDLRRTLESLPSQKGLSAYLLSSMFYRDALNGMYTFGGIYAFGALGWEAQDIGIFGILAAITGAIFAWIGGKADGRFGPKPVILVCIIVLTAVAITVVTITRSSVLFIPVEAGSAMPDIAFYICGCLIGAAGGAIQSSSRSMMVRQANPERMTEAFGLYALAGKATSFIAPGAIALMTDFTGSQRLGISPLIVLFLLGLILLIWVKPNGAGAKEWPGSQE